MTCDMSCLNVAHVPLHADRNASDSLPNCLEPRPDIYTWRSADSQSLPYEVWCSPFLHFDLFRFFMTLSAFRWSPADECSEGTSSTVCFGHLASVGCMSICIPGVVDEALPAIDCSPLVLRCSPWRTEGHCSLWV